VHRAHSAMQATSPTASVGPAPHQNLVVIQHAHHRKHSLVYSGGAPRAYSLLGVDPSVKDNIKAPMPQDNHTRFRLDCTNPSVADHEIAVQQTRTTCGALPALHPPGPSVQCFSAVLQGQIRWKSQPNITPRGEIGQEDHWAKKW
jgi:hypothetical protein